MKFLAPLTDRNRLLELLEFAINSRCSDGEVQDKADHKIAKGFLFEKLAIAYRKKGSRLAPLRQQLSEGYIKWGFLGHYVLEVNYSGPEGLKAAISCKSLDNKKVDIDPEIFGDDAGPFELSHDYSIRDAYIMSLSDKYACQNFFPALARTIKHHGIDSDAQPVVDAEHVGQDKQCPGPLLLSLRLWVLAAPVRKPSSMRTGTCPRSWQRRSP
mmetsp:Transcript_73924/g.159942  ORF Transcript_73924/g.159942 Transcript_73924/m.159942 type:complete len:213 (-) Transcript_73924:290-928(-)